MKEWYNNLEPRERRIVVAGAVFVGIMFIYLILIDPFVSKMHKLKTNISSLQETLTWMEGAADEARLLQAEARSMGRTSISQGQSLLGVIDSSSKAARLGSAVKNIKPEGTSKAHVNLENAVFNDLVRWLESLQKNSGIQIVSSVIEKQKEAGKVDARIVFQSGSE